MDSSRNLSQAFQRFINNTATNEEEAELMEVLNEADTKGQLDDVLQELWKNLDAVQPVFTADKKNDMLQNILQKNRTPVRQMFWKRLVAVAVVLIILASTAYLLLTNDSVNDTTVSQTTEPRRDVEAPKTTKAMITLADGKIIALDSLSSGILAQQGDVQVLKNANGQIIYSGEGKEIIYNMLSNPRGSKVIDMTLADGSRVWLNAGSSLRYPVAFVGNERKVQITGEAYFEVASLPLTPSGGGGTGRMPFIVSHGGMKVTVLGTHFNVNAYEDEENIKVTLLEGSVRVSLPLTSSKGGGTNSVILKPGQQAKVSPNSPLGVGGIVGGVDIDQVMAWKNGKFHFDNADVSTIMRQLSRAYDIEVIYEEPVTEKFGGTVPRDVNLSQVLKMLQLTGRVQFRIENNKVYVHP